MTRDYRPWMERSEDGYRPPMMLSCADTPTGTTGDCGHRLTHDDKQGGFTQCRDCRALALYAPRPR